MLLKSIAKDNEVVQEWARTPPPAYIVRSMRKRIRIVNVVRRGDAALPDLAEYHRDDLRRLAGEVSRVWWAGTRLTGMQLIHNGCDGSSYVLELDGDFKPWQWVERTHFVWVLLALAEGVLKLQDAADILNQGVLPAPVKDAREISNGR